MTPVEAQNILETLEAANQKLINGIKVVRGSLKGKAGVCCYAIDNLEEALRLNIAVVQSIRKAK